ncbi:UDP-N-acetylglucosamine 4,6-dehydratase [Mariniflexile aquimaris]|uniref:UDP-N-acetylglucosamine 4,6-dehydratase n=1 Tax=Mariniflexile aquimaris TaxID=881009 RepID=A0ABW3BUY2_9FLAO
MNQSTHQHIKQLIADSGLLHFVKKSRVKNRRFHFKNETILITGAAGSIGSELARQLLNSQFSKLILIDIAESPLYNLMKAFEHENIPNIEFLLLNITDKASVEHLFETYKPTIVLHAAAYKHVPLMEAHPYEAVKTNIMATTFLADCAIKHGVKKFIFISTDKAVDPISVMGCSKRIAENYLLSLSKETSTKFLIARFGNIMGSNGSVLPLFIKQIESGLPLTLTDNTTSRYFISKTKACHLILELSRFETLAPAIFTFDMGNPITIKEVADCLLSFYPERQIPVIQVGMRPGEKLHEALVSINEELVPTQNDSILLVKQRNNTIKMADFNQLKAITPFVDPEKIKEIFKQNC